MKNKKTANLTYEGLGFPIELIDVPMKKFLGEWVIDIDMNKLQLFVFNGLIHKPFRLTGSEIKFMRKFLELTTTELGKKLGLSHAAIVKWEKDQTKISPTQEVYIRMFFLECLQGKELLKIFDEIKPEQLAKADDEKHPPFSIDLKELREAI